jgi:hypothetical protein
VEFYEEMLAAAMGFCDSEAVASFVLNNNFNRAEMKFPEPVKKECLERLKQQGVTFLGPLNSGTNVALSIFPETGLLPVFEVALHLARLGRLDLANSFFSEMWEYVFKEWESFPIDQNNNALLIKIDKEFSNYKVGRHLSKQSLSSLLSDYYKAGRIASVPFDELDKCTPDLLCENPYSAVRAMESVCVNSFVRRFENSSIETIEEEVNAAKKVFSKGSVSFTRPLEQYGTILSRKEPIEVIRTLFKIKEMPDYDDVLTGAIDRLDIKSFSLLSIDEKEELIAEVANRDTFAARRGVLARLFDLLFEEWVENRSLKHDSKSKNSMETTTFLSHQRKIEDLIQPYLNTYGFTVLQKWIPWLKPCKWEDLDQQKCTSKRVFKLFEEEQLINFLTGRRMNVLLFCKAFSGLIEEKKENDINLILQNFIRINEKVLFF